MISGAKTTEISSKSPGSENRTASPLDREYLLTVLISFVTIDPPLAKYIEIENQDVEGGMMAFRAIIPLLLLLSLDLS